MFAELIADSWQQTVSLRWNSKSMVPSEDAENTIAAAGEPSRVSC